MLLTYYLLVIGRDFWQPVLHQHPPACWAPAAMRSSRAWPPTLRLGQRLWPECFADRSPRPGALALRSVVRA
eukprot:2706668-Alexandrium_andersonii.AAC.1